MLKNKTFQKLISKVVSKKILDENIEVLKFYGRYKETSDIIEKVDIALGRKSTFKVDSGSTLNSEINHYGVSSTTAQKI